MAGRKIASLTMSDSGVVATDSPGKDKEANWLPAPDGPDLSGDAPILAEGDFRHQSLMGHGIRQQ
jgi:hypothetical protein